MVSLQNFNFGQTPAFNMTSPALSISNCIETYIRAKDGNRPHLMGHAFSDNAVLAMNVKTSSITFPEAVVGVQAIADTLVSEFGKRYENIYTFCIGEPPSTGKIFVCDWLVCMSEKDTGAARIGFGQYTWSFATATSGPTDKLEITIEEMVSLPATEASTICHWAETLPYPWCPIDKLRAGMPKIAAVERIIGALADAERAKR